MQQQVKVGMRVIGPKGPGTVVITAAFKNASTVEYDQAATGSRFVIELNDELELEPCKCWSCNGDCGGSQDPGSCGPLEPSHRGPLCLACREQAVVWDDDRTAAQVRVAQDRVQLTVDAFGDRKKSIWLDVADVTALVMALIDGRGELSRERS